MTRRRWMALLFALGSTCFLVGPFPGYVQLVGDDGRRASRSSSARSSSRRAARCRAGWPGPSGARLSGGTRGWWSAIVQSAGTLFFNVTTYQAMHVALTSPEYDKLVWRPDGAGRSASSSRAHRLPRLAATPRLVAAGARRPGWWQPAVNLLGCIFFGISAVAGYVVPSTGSMLDLAAANWNTRSGPPASSPARSTRCAPAEPSKMPLRREIRELEHELESELRR